MATIEKLEHAKAKLTITVDAETFGAALQQAYQKNGKHFNIPGFRKGKAPRKVIENAYGEGVFYEDAFELCWGEAYDKALDEHELIVVDKPSIDIEKISREEGIVFTAEVQCKPEVKLGAYKGIEVEKPSYTVEDADVMALIEQEREKNARFVDVERAVENCDRVIIDYSGSVDGVQFDGGTATEQTLLIGSGTFIPGFEEQVIGMNVGEERDITVTFPEEYHAADLAGKEAVFAIKLHGVQIKELPELDDEFVKDISEFDTLDELKAEKRKELEAQAAASEKQAIENATLKAVCDNAEVEVPACMSERQADYMMRDIAYQLSMSGVSMEDYCNFTGTTMDAMKASFLPDAEARVKMQLVIEAVGKLENVTCDEAEVDEIIAQYAEENGIPVDSFKKQLSADDREYLADRKVAEKTVALLVENAVLVEKKEEAAE